MRRLALVAVVLLLPIVAMLSVLGCDKSPDAPTGVPAVEQPDGDDQTGAQIRSVKQLDQPTPASAAAVEIQQPQVESSPTPAAPPSRIPVHPQVATMPIQSIYYTTKSLDNAPDDSSDDLAKLVAHSTLIVIGMTLDVEPREERIPGRLPSDSSKPDPNFAMIGNIYDIQVERYLKGNGDSTLSVIQSIGYNAIVPSSGNTPDRLVQGRDTAPNLLMSRDSRYLLFLEETDHTPDLWIGIAHPYKFLLIGGTAKVESPVGTLEGAFPDRTEVEFIGLVESLIAGNSEALLQDAGQYAADMGVSLHEAVRRLQAQGTIGKLGAELEANEQSTFGGLWIQHTPEYKAIVAFTREGEETVRRYVTGTSLADMVEVREVEATLEELRRDQREVMAILRELGIRAASGIDIPNNAVQLYLSEGEREDLDAGLKKLGLELPDKVEVVIQALPSPA